MASVRRWVAIGAAGRQLILSLLMGLSELVDYILEKGESQYYIGGFRKHLGKQQRLMSTLLSVGSRVSDRILMMTMKDDRVPLMLPQLGAHRRCAGAELARRSHLGGIGHCRLHQSTAPRSSQGRMGTAPGRQAEELDGFVEWPPSRRRWQ